jgi:hypothetical protein
MKWIPAHVRSHDKYRMIQLQRGNDLRYNQKVTVLGAQTVR